MSVTYTKLFASITESTVWCESSDVRVVWVTMLAMADRRGRVFASLPGLAKRANVTLAAAVDAVERFQSPDPYSRTKDHEGRRIEAIDGGWRLINHAKYRAIRDEEARRESKRDYMRRRRSGQVDPSGQEVDRNGGPVRPQSAPVGLRGHIAEADTEHTTPAVAGRGRMAGPEGELCRAFDEGHRKVLGLPYLCVFGRDSKALKDPLKVYGLPLMLEFVSAFWLEAGKAKSQPDDPRYAAGRAKPNIPGLVGQIPNLMRRYKFEGKAPDA